MPHLAHAANGMSALYTLDVPSELTPGTAVVERVALLLRTLANASTDLSVPAIVRRTGLSKATVHRLLQALLAADLVAKNADTQTYRLGPGCVSLGLAALDGLELRPISRPYLKELRQLCEGTVFLGVRTGTRYLYTDQEGHGNPSQPVRIGSLERLARQVSGRTVLTSIATVMLAFEPPSLLEAVIPAETSNRAEVEREVAVAREQGYAVSLNARGTIRAVSLPISNASGVLLAVTTLSGEVQQWTVEAILRTLPDARSILDDLNQSVAHLSPLEPWE
jgi:DNA-binding IclR family transcriptional regulator